MRERPKNSEIRNQIAALNTFSKASCGNGPFVPDPNWTMSKEEGIRTVTAVIPAVLALPTVLAPRVLDWRSF